ncbi:MAG: dihydrolipoyl dehydrogenase [Deltaproteobacteria bacterium]|nr:dihydrolipoyl dehydrogenase [Deltaproteobacteria bacterium]
MAQSFDLIVLGAGPAGYTAAIRAAQLGMSVLCVDGFLGKDGKPSLGGACLNVGCIPSKALLESSEHFARCRRELASHGIATGEVRIDVAAMLARKDKVVRGLAAGVAGLFAKNKVVSVTGTGRLLPGMQVEVTPPAGGPAEAFTAEHILIATGSLPRDIAAVPMDGKIVVDSTGALDFASVPERLGVIGAGVIGLELGSVWHRLGSRVVLLEAMDTFLPGADEQIAAAAMKEMARQGLDIRLGARVLSAKTGQDSVAVTYEDGSGQHQAEFSKLVVAVGRKPNTWALNANLTGLLLDERGYVHVDEFCRTNLPNIYAVGDVVRGPMLAHKASEEGVMVVERIAGHETRVNYDTIPWVIYTSPEIAWVGRSERQLRAAARDYKTGVFPLSASGRARAMGATVGMTKILADKRSDRILGVHIMAPLASEVIAEAVLAMEFGASTEDLQRTIHAHPSFAETTHEAALAADGRPLNFHE